METRGSHVLVGAVTLGLVLLLVGFALWLARYSGDPKREYDIFFRQSVSGLSVGSAVAFSGVPVGQVRRIALVPQRPEFVRVRIQVDEEVPVLEGTTATLQGVGFTGVTQIQLTGAVAGQAPLTEPGPYGVPVIPSQASGFGELMESAPQVLSRVNILLARLNEVLDDPNRAALAGVLKNLDVTTAALAAEAPRLAAAVRESEATMKAASRAADSVARAGDSATALIDTDLRPLAGNLQATLAAADRTLTRVEALARTAEPGVATLSAETVPEVNRLVRELRTVTEQLGAVTARLDEDPLGALVGGRPLPDYAAEKKQ